VPVPASTAAAGRPRLELRTNTFQPSKFPGWPADDRHLGVQLHWIKIGSVAGQPGPTTFPVEAPGPVE
jgi:hypothetical protein